MVQSVFGPCKPWNEEHEILNLAETDAFVERQGDGYLQWSHYPCTSSALHHRLRWKGR